MESVTQLTERIEDLFDRTLSSYGSFLRRLLSHLYTNIRTGEREPHELYGMVVSKMYDWVRNGGTYLRISEQEKEKDIFDEVVRALNPLVPERDEARKYRFLLNVGYLSKEEVDRHFSELDELMSQIYPGAEIEVLPILESMWKSQSPVKLTVTQIIDPYRGLLLCRYNHTRDGLNPEISSDSSLYPSFVDPRTNERVTDLYICIDNFIRPFNNIKVKGKD